MTYDYWSTFDTFIEYDPVKMLDRVKVVDPSTAHFVELEIVTAPGVDINKVAYSISKFASFAKVKALPASFKAVASSSGGFDIEPLPTPIEPMKFGFQTEPAPMSNPDIKINPADYTVLTEFKTYYPPTPTPAPEWMTAKGVWGTTSSAAPELSPTTAEIKAKLAATIAKYNSAKSASKEPDKAQLAYLALQAKRNAAEVEDFCSRDWPGTNQERCNVAWKCSSPNPHDDVTTFVHGCHLPDGHPGDEHICAQYTSLHFPDKMHSSNLCSVLTVISRDPTLYQVAFFDLEDPTKRRYIGPANFYD